MTIHSINCISLLVLLPTLFWQSIRVAGVYPWGGGDASSSSSLYDDRQEVNYFEFYSQYLFLLFALPNCVCDISQILFIYELLNYFIIFLNITVKTLYAKYPTKVLPRFYCLSCR